MKLSDFATEKEEIKYWERHSIGDYWEDLSESNDIFKRPKLKPVTLKFDPLILQKIKMLAKKRGVPYSAYVRYLLAKSIEDEMTSRLSRSPSAFPPGRDRFSRLAWISFPTIFIPVHAHSKQKGCTIYILYPFTGAADVCD